jgi:hypothetical protein
MVANEMTRCVKALGSSKVPSLVPEGPINFDQLARTSRGHVETAQELLRVFHLQADVLLARMTSEEPKTAAARAHVLADSARCVGAWRVAERAVDFERVARGNGPISLNPAMRCLAAAVVEAQEAIGSFLAEPAS